MTTSAPLAPGPTRRRRPRWPSALGLCAAAACGSATAPGARVRTYEVAAAKAPCTGSFPTECLQVRVPPATAWQLFHDPIDGFAYEPGYRYVLRVAERDVRNPPADGSSVAYRLVRVVSKVRAGG